jgi:hypothetical protein
MIDKALPREHMTQVYNILTREEAGILSQLKTKHTPLNNYLARIGVEESTACTCGASHESIHHFLFRCSRWENEQRNLRETMGDR